LKKEDRVIFYLSTWQDYTMRDLQKELNLTYETIRYRLNRAKKYLRNNYNDKVKPIWA
jgi:DNA-directed RNA polymerase specialized sigma24 family protein